MFTYSISKNHYSGYTLRQTDKVSELLRDLATKCMSPVSKYSDKEMTDVITGREWVSKNHRSNPNIIERGNLGMIDFEGSYKKYDELCEAFEHKKLWFIGIPSQSNLSDTKNARFHIVYKLTEPYSINSEAYKIQAKEFFKFIDYKWDESDSGIDTRATFNACGYFSPTIQLNDAKSKKKKIAKPYKMIEDIQKDVRQSKFNGDYKPCEPTTNQANEDYSNITVRGSRRVKNPDFKILRTLGKGYVLSKDSYIEVSKGRFMTFEKLVEQLEDIEGDNPRISMLGCPICNPEHTDINTVGYAYMQFDSNDKPYIYCTGNACSKRPYFTMAEGNISVYRVDNADGSHKYAMFEDNQIIYSHTRDKNYKFSSTAVADELYNKGQYEEDEYGEYSQTKTINTYITGVESVQIEKNPYGEEGLNIYDKTFTISPPARFTPVEEDADEVISYAVKAFDDDKKFLGYPISLIYISYYLFHTSKIMAVLALVNSDRGSGKSFWVLQLPYWYHGHSKVSAMSGNAIRSGWDDEKEGRRLVVYEDIEHLTKSELGILKSEIKSDATAGDTKMLNIKGKGRTLSFGFNTAITTNAYDQIPFDGSGDRRIYPAPYKMLEKSRWLNSKLKDESKTMIKHRTNAINYLYKIYKHCENNMTDELQEALNYKVPESSIRGIVEDSTSTDGYTAMNIIKRCKSKREIIRNLSDVVASDVNKDDIKDLLSDFEITDDHVRIKSTALKVLWNMLPTGRDSMKSLNNRALLSIFGIDGVIKNVRINGNVSKGVEVRR